MTSVGNFFERFQRAGDIILIECIGIGAR